MVQERREIKMAKKNKLKDMLVSSKTQQIKSKDYLGLNEIPNLDKIKKQFKDSKFPDKTILVRMKLNNGFWDTFTIQIEQSVFKYKGACYVIDTDMLEYDVSSKLWSLFYNQGLCIPIKLTINLSEVRQAIIEDGVIENEASLNPYVLQEVIESQVIQKLLSSQDLVEEMKKIQSRIMWLLCGVAILVFLAVKSGGLI